MRWQLLRPVTINSLTHRTMPVESPEYCCLAVPFASVYHRDFRTIAVENRIPQIGQRSDRFNALGPHDDLVHDNPSVPIPNTANANLFG